MIRSDPVSPDADATVALQALAWLLGDERLASRLLALTGLDPVTLRTRIIAGDRPLMGEAIAFLAAHEPDLIACAQDLGLAPARLAAIGERLASG